MDFENKTILVVGGSGVLGAELARQLSNQGANVFATCSSTATATKIPSEAKLSLQVDLNDSSSIDVLADYLLQNHQLDGILLAAGRVGFGGAEQTSLIDLAKITQVNYLGQAQLVSRLIPLLRQGTESFVAAITGVVAEKIFPGMHAYSASKSALSAWLSSLRLELRRDGIQVLEARPGHTETGLADRPLFGSAPQMPTGMTSTHVVDQIVAAIRAGTPLLSSTDF
jgi:cyclic-di-GMP-binding biofilm dispersal mediator protein